MQVGFCDHIAGGIAHCSKTFDIIYKGYMGFTDLAWLYYDEAFMMWAAMNALQCDQIHLQLWPHMFPVWQ